MPMQATYSRCVVWLLLLVLAAVQAQCTTACTDGTVCVCGRRRRMLRAFKRRKQDTEHPPPEGRRLFGATPGTTCSCTGAPPSSSPPLPPAPPRPPPPSPPSVWQEIFVGEPSKLCALDSSRPYAKIDASITTAQQCNDHCLANFPQTTHTDFWAHTWCNCNTITCGTLCSPRTTTDHNPIVAFQRIGPCS